MRIPPTFADRVRGCLIGGALGDALGYAVELDSTDSIRTRFGHSGLTDPEQLDTPLRFSDDTQLTLYTLDGLIEAIEWANDGVAANETACLWLAYLRWLATQGETAPSSAPSPPPRWIDAQQVLLHRRGPGKASISGLLSGEMGTPARPVNKEAKGSGTVMRSAPFGLLPYVPAETVDRLTMDAAALTHGHPSALHSAAVFSTLIHSIMTTDQPLRRSVDCALARARESGVPELRQRLQTAVSLADDGALLSPAELNRALGTGWVAEEALAIAVYAVLATDAISDAGPASDPQEHFRSALALAVNHDGDSDTTASIAGNIVGAFHGVGALPGEWVDALEGADVVTAMANTLVKATGLEVTG